MHASSIINYHHNHHHQHYYAHQVATEESSDASGLSFVSGRSLVTPHQAIESDDNEESAGQESNSAAVNACHLASTSSAALATAPPSQDNLLGAPQLAHPAIATSSAGQKMHFAVNPYESHENSHEHYRYNNNDTAAYPLANEAHYYEQQLPNSAACHHQAVDLTSEQQHGHFETQTAIYYDLSATERIPSNQLAPSLTPLDYQHQDQQQHQHQALHHHHHQNHNPNLNHHHQHLDFDPQHRQEPLVELHREGNSFAAYNHYEASSSELRYSGEFVSVLAEQNRATRPLEWQDSQQVVVADQAAPSGDGCNHLQQYSYEFASILRPPDGAPQLDRAGGSNVSYTNAFSAAPTGGSGGSFAQQIDTINGDGHGGNFHTTNNENSHQQAIGQHPNDCHLFQEKQQTHAQFSHQILDYETHPLDSSLLGHQDNLQQGTGELSHQQHRELAPSRALSSVSESLSMTTNSDMESIDSALTRDEKKAREANIPLSYHEIVNLSIDQFNEQLSRFPYTETQLTLMKDIRRRGKNKVAAQTCRKRKMEQITELQQEVAELANKRILLALERSRLVQEHAKLSEEYESWRTTC